MSDKILIFYNKAHNTDATIPPWICQARGETHYVNHVTISPEIGFCTKERPDHDSTKACIIVKGTLVVANDEANIMP